MKNFNKIIFLFISIFMISCADASNYKNTNHSSINTEILKEFSKPVIMNFNHAKAISVAIEDFSNSNSIEYPIENYLVSAFEIEECYFVTILIPDNRSIAGYPPRYCINKNSFEIEDLPKSIINSPDVNESIIHPTEVQKMLTFDLDLQHLVDKNIVNHFYRPSGMNGGQAKAINIALESIVASGNLKREVENYFVLVAKTSDNYFVRFGIPTNKAIDTYSHFHYCVKKETYDLVECPEALLENLQDKEWKWLLYERNINSIKLETSNTSGK